MSVTVFSKPKCPQCVATIRQLEKHGLPYDVIDLTQDNAAMEKVQQLGHRQIPVVTTASGDHWSGFRPDRINQLAG